MPVCEHIIPMWLLRATGDPHRKIKIDSAPVTGADIVRPASTFHFPACEKCNEAYGRKLEIQAKTAVEALFAGKSLAVSQCYWLLDWLDKVRVTSSRTRGMALTIDDTDPDSLAQWGRGVAAFSDDYDAAKDAVDRAVTLNPNSARAWTNRGSTYRYMKNVDEAVISFERAIRLNSFDPMLYDTLTGRASSLIVADRDEDAAAQARKALG